MLASLKVEIGDRVITGTRLPQPSTILNHLNHHIMLSYMACSLLSANPLQHSNRWIRPCTTLHKGAPSAQIELGDLGCQPATRIAWDRRLWIGNHGNQACCISTRHPQQRPNFSYRLSRDRSGWASSPLAARTRARILLSHLDHMTKSRQYRNTKWVLTLDGYQGEGRLILVS